jgi:hypothetical protein
LRSRTIPRRRREAWKRSQYSIAVGIFWGASTLIARYSAVGTYMMAILISVGGTLAILPLVPSQNFAAAGARPLAIGLAPGSSTGSAYSRSTSCGRSQRRAVGALARDTDRNGARADRRHDRIALHVRRAVHDDQGRRNRARVPGYWFLE